MFLRRTLTIFVLLVGLMAGAAVAQQVVPSALLTIDQNRPTVVERIVGEWGMLLAQSSVGISAEQLRTMLNGLRADHLLAASLAGSLSGLRDVMANALTSTAEVGPEVLRVKALGDTTDDLVYTPLTPCRLFDTRVSQGGQGAMVPNVRRTYGAITPVPNQGGPGGCNAPTGAAVALVQIGTLIPSGNGYLQGGPQGVASFPNALILYQAGEQPGTAVAMPLNVANGQFDLQVQFAATDLYGDLVGYFARPRNYGGTHTIRGGGATDSGGDNNTVTAIGATVSGGAFNTASLYYSVVGGGYSNTASGSFSMVPGGYYNLASGDNSFAAGTQARTQTDDPTPLIHYGTFVWADNNAFHFNSTASNEFAARATGGVRFVLGIDGAGVPTWTCAASNGNSWACSSDRNLKENFQRVDSVSVLRRVSALPMYLWNAKGTDPNVRHLGPTAQDFMAAFALGNNNKMIGMQDAEGVALAAIQGLHQMMRQKDRKIARLETKAAKVDTLERELNALKAKLGLN